MRIPEKLPILTAIIITAIAALFCIISLTTKGWGWSNQVPLGLFCGPCPKTPQALSIISFLLLIASIITLVLQILGVLSGQLRYVSIILLFIATFFLLGTFAAYFSYVQALGYSYNLMVVAHFFAYVALAATAYWLGQYDGISSSAG